MECALELEKLMFDEIQFIRTGFEGDAEMQMSMEVNIGINTADVLKRKVTIVFNGVKDKEYNIKVKISGYFSISNEADEDLIQNNAVAIVMPYLRSQISLLTAQPGMEPVVLPPMNIVEMFKEAEQ